MDFDPDDPHLLGPTLEALSSLDPKFQELFRLLFVERADRAVIRRELDLSDEDELQRMELLAVKALTKALIAKLLET